jgi:beta-lactam-binding protein with PASTA domain
MSLQVEVQSISATVKCEAGATAECAFDVHNTSNRKLTVGIEATAGDTKAWIAVPKGQAELELPINGQQKVTVTVTVPAATKPGKYSFKMRLYDTTTPTEVVESGAVAVEVAQKDRPPPPPPPPPPPGKKNWLPIIIAASAGGVVLIGGIVAVVYFVFIHGHGVPNLIGKTAQEAGEVLKDKKLPDPVISQTTTGKADPGIVVSQDPAAGAKLPEDGVVKIVIEQLTAPVPQLRGLTVLAAQAELAKAGFAMGDVVPETTGGSPGGTVLSSDPQAGAPAVPGMKVKLTVERELVAVPMLSGLAFDVARERLDALGLLIGRRNEVNGAGAPGTVAAQDPASGNIERGKTITVDIVAQKVAMPHVAGLDVGAAATAVLRAKLAVGPVQSRYAGVQAVGLVEGSDPGEGAAVAIGSPVTLYVRALRPPFKDVAIAVESSQIKAVLLQQTKRTALGVRAVPPDEK